MSIATRATRTGLSAPILVTTAGDRLRWWGTLLGTSAALTAILVNAAFVIMLNPGPGKPADVSASTSAAIDRWLEEHPGIDVSVVEELSASVVLDMPSIGLASALQPRSVWILHPDQHDGFDLEYLLAHELHHVKQNDLIESATIGRMSAVNPLGTILNLIARQQLQDALAPYFNETTGRSDPMEQAADCYAIGVQGLSAGEGPAAYIGDAGCTPEQTAAAQAVHEGVWPSAAVVAELAAR